MKTLLDCLPPRGRHRFDADEDGVHNGRADEDGSADEDAGADQDGSAVDCGCAIPRGGEVGLRYQRHAKFLQRVRDRARDVGDAARNRTFIRAARRAVAPWPCGGSRTPLTRRSEPSTCVQLCVCARARALFCALVLVRFCRCSCG